MNRYMSKTTTKEELLPELALYRKNVNGVDMIQHPYYEFDYNEQLTKMCNDGFETKKKMVENALVKRDWATYIVYYRNEFRLEGFQAIEDLLNDKEYWENLTVAWLNTRLISENIEAWRAKFESDRPNREYMMCDLDRVFFDKLPERFTIYRGFTPGVEGFSYSLNREVSLRFARKSGSEKNITQLEVLKSHCIAYINERDEEEIIYLK